MENTCIDFSVKRIGDILSLEASRLGEGVSFRTERQGGPISIKSARKDGMPVLTAERIGKPMSFRCGLVCSVAEAAYLRVEPEVIWLLPDSAEVAVFSNVTWHIE